MARVRRAALRRRRPTRSRSSPRCANRGPPSTASTSWWGSAPRSGRRSRPMRRHPGRTASTGRSPAPTGKVMPATQHDIVVWLTGSGYDVVFDVSRAIVAALAGHARLAHEIVGWPYHHDRDLTGFIDGTENPSLIEAIVARADPRGRAGRRRLDPPAPAVGARRIELGGALRRTPGGRDRPSQGRQRRTGPATADVPCRPDGPGRLRGDLPAQHRVWLGDRARDDLRRVQRDPGRARRDARQHGRAPGGLIDDLMRFTTPLTGAYYVIPSGDRLAAFGTPYVARAETPSRRSPRRLGVRSTRARDSRKRGGSWCTSFCRSTTTSRTPTTTAVPRAPRWSWSPSAPAFSTRSPCTTTTTPIRRSKPAGTARRTGSHGP